ARGRTGPSVIGDDEVRGRFATGCEVVEEGAHGFGQVRVRTASVQVPGPHVVDLADVAADLGHGDDVVAGVDHGSCRSCGGGDGHVHRQQAGRMAGGEQDAATVPAHLTDRLGELLQSLDAGLGGDRVHALDEYGIGQQTGLLDHDHEHCVIVPVAGE